MIVLFIVILWVTFIIMTFSTLSVKKYRNNQVLGISLSKEHFQHSEVKKVIDSFNKACYMVLLISMGLSLLLFVPLLQLIGEAYLIVLIVFNIYLNWHVLNKHGNELMSIKGKNNWVYPIKTTKTIDLNVSKEKAKWKWGCYYDPKDSRILVPKRVSSMGKTINIGRLAGKAIFFGIIILVIGIIGLTMYGSLKDYKIMIVEDEISIDAAMYDMIIKRDEVVSVSIIDERPSGIRTNGYGGTDKSYGNFNIDNYGRSKLYVYNKINRHVVLELDGNNPSYVFINSKTVEDTEDLYNNINKWYENELN